jgi:ATP-dependent helicase/nuclease subunit A
VPRAPRSTRLAAPPAPGAPGRACWCASSPALKRDEGWVDMNDVEQAAHLLLSDPVLSGWIQERLDARMRHLLVDEFQDTNPLQWQALHAWLSGYAGAGGSAPSVFIVGDPKQSIYRFRRAEPQVFAPRSVRAPAWAAPA